jgi:hypothetical protein
LKSVYAGSWTALSVNTAATVKATDTFIGCLVLVSCLSCQVAPPGALSWKRVTALLASSVEI